MNGRLRMTLATLTVAGALIGGGAGAFAVTDGSATTDTTPATSSLPGASSSDSAAGSGETAPSETTPSQGTDGQRPGDCPEKGGGEAPSEAPSDSSTQST